MVNKKVVAICSIIALIIVVSIVVFQIKKFKELDYIAEEVTVSNQNIALEQNSVKNEVKEEISVVENDIGKENISAEDIPIENTTQTQVQGEEENDTEENNQNNSDKALRLVKEEWGEDNTVYYTIDNQSNNTYHISVRSKSTTATLAEYEVDVSKGIAVIK